MRSRQQGDDLVAAGPATPEENAELVDRTYRLIEDLQGPQPALFDRDLTDCVHEAFELHLPDSYPEGEQVFRRRAGLTRWIAMFKEVWGEWRFELERVVAREDWVLALVRVLARGGSSGVRLYRETAHLWTIRDGQVARCQVYLDRSEALERLGLRITP